MVSSGGMLNGMTANEGLSMKPMTTSRISQLCQCWILAVRVREDFMQGFGEVGGKLRHKTMK